MTQALASAGCEVTLLLKAPVRTERLTAPLAALAGVTLRRPHEEGLVSTTAERGLSPELAVSLIGQLDQDQPADLIVVRGRRLAALAAQEQQLHGRLWTYLTDIPQSVSELTPAVTSELSDIAVASRVLLCQTEDLRCFLESVVPAACGKSVVFGPVVDVDPPQQPRRRPEGEPLRLVYTGKFAPRWQTLEMTELPAALAERNVSAELHMVGDKIHRDPSGWSRRMRRALENTPGVIWHGGMSRSEALDIAAGCDLGLSWRSAELDASLELSTKVLELGALGVPVLLNRTPMHEELLGADYPLFVDAHTEPDAQGVAGVVAATLAPSARGRQTPGSPEEPPVSELAVQRCRQAAGQFTLERAAQRLRELLAEVAPRVPSAAHRESTRPLRVVIAGHDLKFFTRLGEHLAALPGLELRFDEWEGISTHDEYRSSELAAWADVVVCEWCGPNALFYASRKRRGQRLVVRLHRFELYAQWPHKLDIDQVDAVVCVSPHYAQRTREETGWPEEKVVVLPNWVDARQLDRPKLPGAEYTLGMVGAAPSRKRLDRALDVLAELRHLDSRYTLAVKTRQPWDYWWVWNRPEERDYYERTYRRIQRSEPLAGGVVFDPFGPDIAAWLRRVGFVLSTSDDESFHLAPAECAASGGVPVVLAWPGAHTIYSERWVHPDTTTMAAAIHRVVTGGRFEETRRVAQREIVEQYSLERVRQLWTDLVIDGRLPRGTDPWPATGIAPSPTAVSSTAG
ncbi:glycosyltransferase [Lipingzhangella sp. LS1_29]|uniref:Glycosyltransferase n=1 Tax=Lipingzhangella rawalii TaxID=2055835 RepID=A0ABU2H349_9ACTN|nr:glycosyltransferase [Lipingzhangella rawalii]MDS1269727.1 glycosyltransferase [Lipingzhangella rawalii]